jgi:hypothetical protein
MKLAHEMYSVQVASLTARAEAAEREMDDAVYRETAARGDLEVTAVEAAEIRAEVASLRAEHQKAVELLREFFTRDLTYTDWLDRARSFLKGSGS